MIKPLTLEEIKLMTTSCQIAAQTLVYLEKYIKPGITTQEIDLLSNDFMLTKGAKSACIGYSGYPKFTCTSVNDVVCHGVPSEGEILQEGDIINVDVTALYKGFHGDTSRMFTVGKVSAAAQEICDIAREARDRGIEAITPNGFTGDIGFETYKFVTRKGFDTVKEIGGHGVGRIFHDEPFVPSFGKKGKGDRLVPFHCITVEPMINAGTDEIEEFSIPGSRVKYYRTLDRKLSAQYEHTVLVTDTGYEILTLP